MEGGQKEAEQKILVFPEVAHCPGQLENVPHLHIQQGQLNYTKFHARNIYQCWQFSLCFLQRINDPDVCFKIDITALNLNVEYRKNGTWLQPKTFQSLIRQKSIYKKFLGDGHHETVQFRTA